MFKPHLKAFYDRLKAQTEATDIDHWNNQPANWEAYNILCPAVFIDFGSIPWVKRGMGANVKEGTALITVYCASQSVQATQQGSADNGGQQLERFDWSEKVLQALDGFAATDDCGNQLFTALQLADSTMDTNADALKVDMLQFTCKIYCYSLVAGNKTGLIETIEQERDPTLKPT